MIGQVVLEEKVFENGLQQQRDERLRYWYTKSSPLTTWGELIRQNKIFEPRHEKTDILVSNTNQAVQLQRLARSLKFWIKKVEGSYYL